MERELLNSPSSVEAVFQDFKGRRAGLIKALTIDFEEFYKQCDPDPEKGRLCLYGLPTELWMVVVPAKEFPRGPPDPALGINIARDAMQEKEWLSFVANSCDDWLRAVFIYFGGIHGFDKADRKRLFTMTNDLPTIFEVVTETALEQEKAKSGIEGCVNITPVKAEYINLYKCPSCSYNRTAMR